MAEPGYNILFLTLAEFDDIEDRGIYKDLLRCMRDRGHRVYIVNPHQKREGKQTECVEKNGVTLLHVRTGNLTKTKNIIEKGLSTVSLDPLFIRAIRRWYSDVRFDLVLYSTPPVTLVKTVSFLKRRDGCRTFLLLKDIFPQNAVDIGLMKTGGPAGLLYRWFRRTEKRLYAVSDRIGCMSQANVDYLLEHNPELPAEEVCICPNSIIPWNCRLSDAEKAALRRRWGIPQDRILLIYGGNLGKPQGIPYLIECLRAQRCAELHFLIVGDGTEYPLLERFVQTERPDNVTLLQKLPQQEYEALASAADVGMIVLDCRFTIPNFPSRLLSYLNAAIPVLAMTDRNTDLGQIITDGGFGWWCESRNVSDFLKLLERIRTDDRNRMGEAGRQYLLDHYDAEKACDSIIRSFSENGVG
ncbi:MAG: glycosyltransferase family 4 protein [Oscillospiraceae bacterium]|nr:glycosyltransferase family 4 protein [Oscillospiraceae bacterium]